MRTASLSLVSVLCAMSLCPSFASARTLIVGQAAPTLSETIELSRAGDIVELPAGTWTGPITIDRRITLRGEGTIDGAGSGTVLRVAAPQVIIDGVRVQHSGANLSTRDSCIYTEPTATGVVIRNTVVRDCAFGIWLHETDRARVENNRVFGRTEVRTSDRGNGIHLFDADGVVVRKNRVRDARDGIYVSASDDCLFEENHVNHQRYGVHYMYSYRNTLRDNRATENHAGGFALMQSRELIVEGNTATNNEGVGLLFRDAQECRINRNHLERNGQGMFFFSSTDNVIEGNRLIGNQIGAKIWAGSLRNTVRNNAFVANSQQVFYVAASDLVWGEDGPGNYFSDYIGWDQNGDHVGDRAHRLDSFSTNLIHRYPSTVLLMRSPILELLGHLEARMPVLQVPTVVDLSPLMSRP